MHVKLSFDDGCAEDLRIIDLLDKYNLINAIFYIPVEWQSYNLSAGREPLTFDDLELISDKFEIGSHTITHRLLTRIPYGEAAREIIDSKDMLENLLDIEIASFCPPRGYLNEKLKTIVAEVYESCRSTLVGNIKEPDPLWQVTSVHAGGKRRKEYEGTSWFEEGMRLLELARRTPDSTYHLWAHSWELSRHGCWDEFETLLQELAK